MGAGFVLAARFQGNHAGESRVSSSAVNSRRIPNEVHNSGTIQGGRPMSDDFVETFLSELEAIYKNNPNVQDGTVHAPAGLCADKDCETIPLLKWRLDRYVLKSGRVSGVRATAATVARTTRRFAGASTTRSTTRVSTGSQGAAVIEETKENHESSCLPRHERCQR